MKIGQAAAESGLSVKAIRHYEAQGLLSSLKRNGSYRSLSRADVSALKVIAHCRDLQFSLPEIKRVLELVANAAPECPPPDAMLSVVEARLEAIRNQIRTLRAAERRVAKAKQYLKTRRAEHSP